MPDNPPVEIQSAPEQNLARVRYHGHVTVADMKVALTRIESLLPQLRPGFTVFTDLSDLDSMDLDCVVPLTKIMDCCRAAGVGTVVRVVPDTNKDIGFNILSIIHYRHGVKIVTCATLAEAERELNVSPP